MMIQYEVFLHSPQLIATRRGLSELLKVDFVESLHPHFLVKLLFILHCIGVLLAHCALCFSYCLLDL